MSIADASPPSWPPPGRSPLAPGTATAAPTGTTSLTEVLAADGNRYDRNWEDFDIVEKAVPRC